MYRPIQVTSPTLRDYWSLAISSGRSRRTHATLQIRLTAKSGSLKSPGAKPIRGRLAANNGSRPNVSTITSVFRNMSVESWQDKKAKGAR